MSSPQSVRVRTKPFTAACIAAGFGAALLQAGAGPAQADEHMNLIAKIDVGGNGLGAFDISVVDPVIDLYVLADRTNASVDLIDASDNSFIGRVGGFTGVVKVNGKVDNDLSGPDGALIINHREVWAGDGDSTVKIIDLASKTIVDTISTGGSFRADEMAWDRRDHIFVVANDADTPPYLTFIDTDTHKVLGKLNIDGTNGTPNATGGIEQPQWSPQTGMIYLSVPQVGSNPGDGGVAVINPRTMKGVAVYPDTNCTPTGLALGPHRQALLGCSVSTGTAPNVVTQTLVIDITNGDIMATIPIGGSDEVWYDRGSNQYYLGARANKDNNGNASPILGVVDASSFAVDPSPATSTTSHSVAADSFSLKVFVPIGFVPPTAPAGTDPTNPCPTTGCIAVFVPSGNGRQGHDRDVARGDDDGNHMRETNR